MEFSIGDLITIIIFVVGLIGGYIKLRESIINSNKDTEREIALMKQDMTTLKNNNNEKDIKFEKVLEKLEQAIEELNKSQLELSKAIILLQAEIKNKIN